MTQAEQWPLLLLGGLTLVSCSQEELPPTYTSVSKGPCTWEGELSYREEHAILSKPIASHISRAASLPSRQQLTLCAASQSVTQSPGAAGNIPLCWSFHCDSACMHHTANLFSIHPWPYPAHKKDSGCTGLRWVSLCQLLSWEWSFRGVSTTKPKVLCYTTGALHTPTNCPCAQLPILNTQKSSSFELFDIFPSSLLLFV